MAGRLRALRRSVAALLLAASGGAAAQTVDVVIVDVDRVLDESAAAAAIDARERVERRALRDRLDALKRDLEAEEAELSRLRDEGMAREAFDARVRAFDRRVRESRAAAQQAMNGLAQRFGAARSALRARLDPVLDALLAERGAAIAIDADAALRAAPEADATDRAIEMLDAALPASALETILPDPAPDPRAPSAFAPAEGR